MREVADRGWPVSVKDVLIRGAHTVPLKERAQRMELPGGRLDRGESPDECVVRE
jgi:8-oxo-dGTP pyrophosphatase MutT (NUDIX family)